MFDRVLRPTCVASTSPKTVRRGRITPRRLLALFANPKNFNGFRASLLEPRRFLKAAYGVETLGRR